MRRLFGVLAILVVVLLALDAAGVVPLVLSERATDRDDRDDLIEGEGTEAADGVGLHGAGREAKKDEEAPEPEPEPEVLSEVRGTTVNGGVLRGRVVQGDPPLPVAGVRVTLARPDAIFSYLRAEVKGRFDQLEATTNDEGRFAFLHLTPSKDYVVRALHPEFAVSSSPKIDLRGGGERDLGDLPLGQGGQITGRILDARGSPVANARIVVTWVIRNALNSILTEPKELPEIEREGTSDEEGVYRIERLEPGWKTVIVVTPYGASDAHPRLKIDDGETFEAGDWKLSGTHFIGGRVIWADGKPIPDVRVVAAPFGRPVGRQALTDADGRFRLEHLPKVGNYAVGTMVPGLPVALSTNVALDRDDLEIKVAAPSSLSGVVLDAEERKPVKRFRILAKQKPTGNFIRDLVAKTVTQALGPASFEDEDGGFHFPRMPVGHFQLEITAPGYAPRHMEIEVPAGGFTTAIVLERGKRALGHVFDSDGNAVPEAHVFVFGAGEVEKLDPNELERALGQRMPGGTTDENGAFALPPQAPGAYDLVAASEGRLPGVVKGVALGDEDVEGVQIRMPPSARIAGKVVGPLGRKPGDQLGIVAVFSDLSWRHADTDEDGRFVLDRLPVARVLVRWGFEVEQQIFRDLRSDDKAKAEAAYEKLKADTEEHTLRNGQTLEVTVTIPRRTLVKGRVMSGGAPATTARGVYWLSLSEGQGWQWCRLNKDASFDFRLVPGAYNAYIPTERGNWLPQRIEIPDLDEYELEIERPREEDAGR